MPVTRTLVIAAALVAAAPALAQNFPVPGKPIRIVVPFPPGGQTDVYARLVGPRLTEALGGTPVVVENKPGANTALGAADVARSAPDGHSILFTNPAALTQLPHLVSKLQYDPVKDFTPVAQFVTTTVVLVANPSVPANTVGELIAYAKANPAKLNYASFAMGSSSHLYAEMLKLQAGVDIVHVPYKGTADAMRDLLGGQVQLMFDGLATATANTRAGKVKALGIADKKRNPALPDVPTFTEQGIAGVDVGSWIGFFGPGGLPREVTARLNGELVKIARVPEVSEVIRKGGNEPAGGTPEEFAREVQSQSETWGRVIRQIGIRLD
jgi:tripartite-type tricarboxylate transporter receptor subunit TctC